jgi:hypothetical protein
MLSYKDAAKGWVQYDLPVADIQKSINAGRTSYHEAIDGKKPMRLFFDIEKEFSMSEWKSLAEDELVIHFLEVVHSVVLSHTTLSDYNFRLWRMSRIVMGVKNGKDNNMKMSWHVVMSDVFVRSYLHLNVITDDVISILATNPEYDTLNGCVDRIGKTAFNLRMPGCYKGDHQKSIDHELYYVSDDGFVLRDGLDRVLPEYSELLIQPDDIETRNNIHYDGYANEIVINHDRIHELNTHRADLDVVLSDKTMQDALDAILKSTCPYGVARINYLEYRNTNGRFINFDATSPYMCALCNRMHEKDSPFGMICDNGTVMLKCRRAAKDVVPEILTICACGATKKNKGSYANFLKYMVSEWALLPDSASLIHTERNPLNRYVDNTYNERYCTEITQPDMDERTTYYIKAQLGTGKTKTINDLLTKLVAYSQSIISPRISLVRSARSRIMKEHGMLFEIYSDTTEKLTSKLLVCQTDSVNRIARIYDVLVLDEVESVLTQTNSTQMLEPKQNLVQTRLIELIKGAKVLVASDGHMSSETMEFIESIRTNTTVHSICNMHKPYRDYVVDLSISRDDWHSEINDALNRGERIVIAMNTLLDATALDLKIRTEYPNLSVGLYTSDLEPKERIRIFDDIDTEFGSRDVVIYTSTISSGVSFDAERFDRAFGYFFAGCGTHMEAIQMLHRVRKLSQKHITVYIDPSTSRYGMDLPTSRDALIAAFTDHISNAHLSDYYDEVCPNIKVNMVSSYLLSQTHLKDQQRSRLPATHKERMELQLSLLLKKNREAMNYTSKFLACLASEGMCARTIVDKVIPSAYADLEPYRDSVLAELAKQVKFARPITSAQAEEHDHKTASKEASYEMAAFKFRRHYGLNRQHLEDGVVHIQPISLRVADTKTITFLLKHTTQTRWGNWKHVDGKNTKDVSSDITRTMVLTYNPEIAKSSARQKCAVFYLSLLGYEKFETLREISWVSRAFQTTQLPLIKEHLCKMVGDRTAASIEIECLEYANTPTFAKKRASEWTFANTLKFLNKNFIEFDMHIGCSGFISSQSLLKR